VSNPPAARTRLLGQLGESALTLSRLLTDAGSTVTAATSRVNALELQ
jgi:hypothetical protein